MGGTPVSELPGQGRPHELPVNDQAGNGLQGKDEKFTCDDIRSHELAA